MPRDVRASHRYHRRVELDEDELLMLSNALNEVLQELDEALLVTIKATSARAVAPV
jgi:hypothetical protein